VNSPNLVKKQRSGPVATLILNRPERHNSLVPALLLELLAALEEVDNDPTVRAIVLGAEGRSFSTGGDVKAFFSAGEDLSRYATETVELLNQAIQAMLQLPKPIVTAVHGLVTGGSLGLLLGSDVVLMARDATITPWYSVVGFSPDGGWTAMLPDLTGRKRASDVLLRNRTIDADQAVDWGIASEVVDGGSVLGAATAVAQEIAEMVPRSIAAMKRQLWVELADVAARLEAERKAFVEQIVTPEALKGMAAFLGRAK
jgi:2-(1,2-epoxy-1,2-dihydrophenyl)acetyl-CoA isomerase